MSRKFRYSALFVLMTMLLAACGKKEETVRYAIITGTDGGSGNDGYSAIISGIETFCGENGFSYQVYSATEDTEEGYKAQIETAASDGAHYIVAHGKKMETAVYDGQDDHRKTRFLFFEGEPRKSETDEESSIRSNTECLAFGKSDIGFLAGYTALRDGSRGVAFISADNSGDTAEYFEGFRRGVAYAENELMLTSNDLSLYSEFCGSGELSPRRLGDALDFYNGGVDLIITDQEGVAEAADRAAAAAGSGAVATLGFDAASELTHLKYAVMTDRENAAKAFLSELESTDSFEGGTVKELNAGQYAAMISADFSHFIAFGQDSYRSILNAMAQMSQSASASGEDGEESAPQYGTADADSVTVTEVTSGSISDHMTGGGQSVNTETGSTEEGEAASAEVSDETSQSDEEASQDGDTEASEDEETESNEENSDGESSEAEE